MANTIKIKYSDTLAATPTLSAGELAINRADKLLFYTDDSNVLQSFDLTMLGGGGGGIDAGEAIAYAIALG